VVHRGHFEHNSLLGEFFKGNYFLRHDYFNDRVSFTAVLLQVEERKHFGKLPFPILQDFFQFTYLRMYYV
jgi:hypothetical protein